MPHFKSISFEMTDSWGQMYYLKDPMWNRVKLSRTVQEKPPGDGFHSPVPYKVKQTNTVSDLDILSPRGEGSFSISIADV